MIYVISQIKFITELNPLFIKTGFFVVKNVGMLFLNIIIIPTVAQENLNNKFSCKIICKNNQIIRSLEVYKIILNINFKINDYF